MAWCHQTTSYYPCQSWLRSMMLYGVTKRSINHLAHHCSTSSASAMKLLPCYTIKLLQVYDGTEWTIGLPELKKLISNYILWDVIIHPWRNHNGSLAKHWINNHIPQLYAGVLDLTHWGRVTHICVSKLTIICSDNGLSPGQRQAIIWTNAEILLIRTLATKFSKIFSEINTFSFTKMRLKILSVKWCQICPGLNVFMTV